MKDNKNILDATNVDDLHDFSIAVHTQKGRDREQHLKSKQKNIIAPINGTHVLVPAHIWDELIDKLDNVETMVNGLWDDMHGDG